MSNEDYWEALDTPDWQSGSIAALDDAPPDRGRKPREFFIGFAGAAPGPSHEEPQQRRRSKA